MRPWKDIVTTVVKNTANRVGVEVLRARRMQEWKERQALLVKEALANMPARKGKTIAEGLVVTKDRPMQLHMTLTSYFDMVKNPVPLTIIYCATSTRYQKAYDEIAAEFKDRNVTLVPEEGGFKAAIVRALEGMSAPRMFYMMDDDVYVHPVDYQALADLNPLEYVISPSISPSITHVYTMQCKQTPPVFRDVPGHDDMRAFTWGEQGTIWDYPLCVVGTLFDTNEMLLMTRVADFKAPNSLEGKLMDFATDFRKRTGVCWAKAPVVNMPLNKVQVENDNLGGVIGSRGSFK